MKLLVLVICTALLSCLAISCGIGVEGPQSTEPQSTKPQPTTPNVTDTPTVTIDDSVFSFIKGGEESYCVVVPEALSVNEFEVLNSLRQMLASKFGKAPDVKHGAIPTDRYALVFGRSTAEVSPEFFAGLKYGDFSISITDGKMLFGFTSTDSGKDAVAALGRAIDECTGEDKQILSNWRFEKMAQRNVEIPTPTLTTTEVDCGDNTTMYVATAASASNFDAYVQQLADAGFSEYGEATEAAGNSFATFVKENVYVYVYYISGRKELRIITGPGEMLPGTENDLAEGDEVTTTALGLIGQDITFNCGQGNIFRLPDGKFLVHDGGADTKDVKDRIYKALRSMAHDPENIVIAAWFISHPHMDHQDMFIEFLENHSDDPTVTLESIVFNYGPSPIYSFTRTDNGVETSAEDAERMRGAIEQYAPNVKMIKAHTGQKLYYSGAVVEVLFTVEDILPQALDYVNTASMVISIDMGGHKIMMLADTTHKSGAWLTNAWGEYLKSDIVQIAHHGMWASTSLLYNRIKADVIMWPNQWAIVKEWLNDGTVKAALEHAKDIWIAGEELCTVYELPYELENNKAQVIEQAKNS